MLPQTGTTDGCQGSTFRHQFVFLLLQTESVRATIAVVPHRLPVAIQVPVIACPERQLDDTSFDAFGVNLHRLVFLLLVLGRGRFLFLLAAVHCLICGQEGRGSVVRQQGQVDAAHTGIDVVPLQTSVDGIEIAVGLKDQVFAVGTEDR